MIYKLIEEDEEGNTTLSVELTKFEFKQAFTMHKRLEQRKDR